MSTKNFVDAQDSPRAGWRKAALFAWVSLEVDAAAKDGRPGVVGLDPGGRSRRPGGGWSRGLAQARAARSFFRNW